MFDFISPQKRRRIRSPSTSGSFPLSLLQPGGFFQPAPQLLGETSRLVHPRYPLRTSGEPQLPGAPPSVRFDDPCFRVWRREEGSRAFRPGQFSLCFLIPLEARWANRSRLRKRWGGTESAIGSIQLTAPWQIRRVDPPKNRPHPTPAKTWSLNPRSLTE